MVTPGPWVFSLLELMKHAEEHQQASEEFDKRIALIGYDNAIEVSISTYLQLHPTQREKASYPSEHIEKWLANYHSLLGFFFDEFLRTSNRMPPFDKQTVIHYHNLRNDLYHKGKSLIPTERDINGARDVAFYIISTLFNVKGEELLKSMPPLHSRTRKFNFQSSGNDIRKIPLKVGSAIFRFRYEGQGYLTAYLKGEDDKSFVARIVEHLGLSGEDDGIHTYTVNGTANIEKDAVYLLRIYASGNWQAEIEQ